MPDAFAKEGTSTMDVNKEEEHMDEVQLNDSTDVPQRAAEQSTVIHGEQTAPMDTGTVPTDSPPPRMDATEKPEESETVLQKPPRASRNAKPLPHKSKIIDSSSDVPDFKPTVVPKGHRMDGWNIRYIVLLLTVVCLGSIMANIVCFNFVVLCMPGTDEAPNLNHTYTGYTKDERTWLYSSVAMGALFAVVPASHMISVVGVRKLFFAAGLLTALSTLFTPFAARMHIAAFVATRFIQGVSFATCMPVAGAVTSTWASLAQNGIFISVLTAFGQLAAIFSMPVAGQLCETSLGWSSVFYLHGALSLLVFTAWFLIYGDDPANHSLVSKRELAEIQSGKRAIDAASKKAQEAEESENSQKIPYLEILTTPSVWGVWIGALGDLVAVQLVHTFSPVYIRTILGYSIEKTGWTAAVPVLVQFLVKVSAGHSSDRITFLSETTKIRIYNSIALGVSALFLIVLAYLPKGYPTLGVVLLTLVTAAFGFNGGGFNKCAALVSRQYTHFVLAHIQFLWCLSMLICPILVSFILTTGSPSEWRTVYILHAVILLISNAVFCVLATAKPAKWTDRSIQEVSLRNTPMWALA